MKNILFFIVILTNLTLIIFTVFYIQKTNNFEAKLNQLQQKIENPEVRIVPVK